MAKEESVKEKKVTISYNKIIIGQEWRWNYVVQKLEKINPKASVTKTNRNYKMTENAKKNELERGK